MRFISIDLLRQRARVRRAEQILRHDKAETARAFERVSHDVIASPSGLAVCAMAGFLIDTADGDDRSRHDDGLAARLRSVTRLLNTVHMLLSAMRSTAQQE
jgi:hypothetical protein